MTYMMIKIYFDTVWETLSEGLRKRIAAAVRQSREGNSSHDVIVGGISQEHRSELEQFVADQATGKNGPFVMAKSGAGSKTGVGVKLHRDLVDYILHEVLEPAPSKG